MDTFATATLLPAAFTAAEVINASDSPRISHLPLYYHRKHNQNNSKTIQEYLLTCKLLDLSKGKQRSTSSYSKITLLLLFLRSFGLLEIAYSNDS